METAKSKPVETRDQAINRLAVEARKRGVQVFSYPRTNEFYATSSSNPETLHRVTLLSCDCAGYFSHGRCTHHAALLDSIGELPPVDPTPIATTPEERETQGYPTPALVDLPAVLQARAELARLESLWERGKLKSCDVRGLQNARARFAELHPEGTRPAALVAVAS